MNMGGTECKTVVDQGWVYQYPLLCSLQQVIQEAQVSVAAPYTVAEAILIKDKHLAW